MIKTPSKLGIKGKFLNLIKGVYIEQTNKNNPTSKFIFRIEKLNANKFNKIQKISTGTL